MKAADLLQSIRKVRDREKDTAFLGIVFLQCNSKAFAVVVVSVSTAV